SLEWSPGAVVLDPVAAERQDRAVVGVDGHLHVDLPVGLGQEDPDAVFDVEQRGGAVDVLTDRRIERRRHVGEATDAKPGTAWPGTAWPGSGWPGSGKAPGRLAVVIALAEPQAPSRAHPEHEDVPPGLPVAEGPVPDDEVPRTGRVLDREGRRHGLELGVVHDRFGPALEDDVERPLDEGATPGRQHARRVLGQVPRLALVGPGGEPEGLGVPDGDQRRDVWSPVGTDGGQPERVGLAELLEPFDPRRRRGVRLAEPVDLGDDVLRGHPMSSLPPINVQAFPGSTYGSG